jgi:hypothetical protein
MSEAASEPTNDLPGCLTAAEVETLRLAPPGGAPPELARHLASCARCQERALAGESLRSGGENPPRTPPQPGRTLVMLLLLLFGAFVALYSIRWAVGL